MTLSFQTLSTIHKQILTMHFPNILKMQQFSIILTTATLVQDSTRLNPDHSFASMFSLLFSLKIESQSWSKILLKVLQQCVMKTPSFWWFGKVCRTLDLDFFSLISSRTSFSFAHFTPTTLDFLLFFEYTELLL